MASIESATSLIGHTVAVTLRTGAESGEATRFTSVLFAVDKGHNLVVFRSSPAHTFAKGEYRLVPLPAIASIEDCGASAEPLPAFRAMSSDESAAKFSQAFEAIMKKRQTRGQCLAAWGCCRDVRR